LLHKQGVVYTDKHVQIYDFKVQRWCRH